MDTRNCPKCSKLFNRVNSNICPACEKEEELMFQKVKDFINDNRHCTLAEVSAETGASGKKILRYVKEGRLEITSGMKGDVECEMCGKPITKGRFCDKCVIKINHDVQDMFTAEKKSEAKMHIRSEKGRK